MEQDVFRFDDASLFGEYRSAEIESISALYSYTTAPGREVIVVEDEEERHPPQPVNAEEEGVREAALSLLLEQQSAMVYTIFTYLSESFVERLTPSMDDFLGLIHDRSKPLLAKVVEQRAQIEAVWRVFIQRMIVEILAVDHRGVKIKEVLTRLEELYLVRGGKSNLANLDRVRALLKQTTAESRDFEHDSFYRKCAGPQKRGRRPGSENQNIPHELNLIKQHFVTKKTVASPNAALDTYPLFVKVLSIVNDCVPSAGNHGWYLETLHHAVRTLTWREWPAHGLVRSLLNAERVLEKRIRILTPEEVDQASRPLLCAYSGAPLVAGEPVWHLRILLNSGARHLEWVKLGRMPAEPNIDPLFTGSVRAYLIKFRVISLCSVFYSELLSSPPMDPPEVIPPQLIVREGGLPSNRQYSLNTLWLLMNQLRNFIGDNQLGPHIFHKSVERGVDCYTKRLALLGAMISQIEEASFCTHLRTILLVATLGNTFMREICSGKRPPHPNVNHYADMIQDTVLDFIDLMFSFSTNGQALSREVVVFRQFNLPLFDVVMNESAQSKKRFLAENAGNKNIRPRLRDAGDPFLPQLFALSAKRALIKALPSHQEQRERLSRLEVLLAKHPFLFMSLFEFIFEMQPAVVRLSTLPDSVTLLNKMHLCINTTK